MDDKHLISDDAIENIKRQGCCLGRYRTLMSDGYYCYLEGVFDCPHQEKKYIKQINSHMMLCRTNSQLPCQECEKYKQADLAIESNSYDLSA